MKRHLLSFLRSPHGYAINFVATATEALQLHELPIVGWIYSHTVCPLGCMFCLRDGVQDDPLWPLS